VSPPLPPKRTLGVVVPTIPRAVLPSAPETLPPEDREMILKELRKAERRINDLDAERESELRARSDLVKRVGELETARFAAIAKPPEPAPHTTKASFLAHAGAIGMAVAAIVTAAAQCSRPPPPELKADRVYETLKTESERQARDTQQLRKDVAELTGWLAGFLKASGTKVAEPPGVPPPPVKVEIEPPRPGTKRPPAKPVQVVRTPIPTPSPATRPPKLPQSANEL
jgi:hypothetical protein